MDAFPTAPSFTFEVTFDDPGSFDYLCTVHPGMQQGNITVESVAAAEFELLSVDAAADRYKPDAAYELAG